MEQIAHNWPENRYQPEKPEEIVITMNGKHVSDVGEINFEEIVEERGECQIEFQLAEKKLELTIMERSDHKIYACSRIDNIERKNDFIKGKTTLLYEKIKAAIQEISDQINMPVCYEFSTDFVMADGQRNPMRKWATSSQKGQKIFEWDDVKVDNENKCVLFKKVFYPKKQELKKTAA